MEGPVEPFRLANGNPHHELGQVYESIRVQLRAMPSIPFLNQQDLQYFVTPPDEYIPERHANLTIEEIAAAYAPPAPINYDTPSTATSHSTSLDDSEPRPLITRTELNQALEVVQLSDRTPECYPTRYSISYGLSNNFDKPDLGVEY